MKYYAVVKEFVTDDGIELEVGVIGIYTDKGKARIVLDMASCEYKDMINSFDTVERDENCICAFNMGFYGSEHISISIQEVDNDYLPNQPKE